MTRATKLWVLLFTAALTLGVLALSGEYGVSRLLKLRRDTALQQAKNQRLRQQNLVLEQQMKSLSPDGDLRALEEEAREDLGLIRPGEIVFQFGS